LPACPGPSSGLSGIVSFFSGKINRCRRTGRKERPWTKNEKHETNFFSHGFTWMNTGFFTAEAPVCVRVRTGRQRTQRKTMNKESGIRNRIFYHRGHGEARGRIKNERLIHEGAAGPWHEGTPKKTTPYFLCHRERRGLRERFRKICLILCNSWICSLFVIHNILSCNSIQDICQMCRPDNHIKAPPKHII
jgi:hypothetical protein